MVIVITGPTATGKTKLSISLAKKLNGEIINGDAMQIYKNNDVATAKITINEMKNIKHHLFSIKELNDEYTVYDYQKDARKIIDDIISRGKTPIIVGGTGLYIKAALYNYEFEDEIKINKEYNESTKELYNRLLSVDENTNIDKNNRQRIIRALEYYDANKKAISSKEKSNQLLYDTIFIGLTTNRDYLYERINNRVDEMIINGLLDEAKKMYDLDIRSKAVMTPIGYKELFPYFKGEKDLSECLDEMKKNSRHYAKRQYTFFNHQLPINWFNVDYDNFNNTVNEVYNFIQEKTEETTH